MESSHTSDREAQSGQDTDNSEGLFRKPVPEGVVEIIDSGVHALIELKDGSLLADNGRISRDGGKTWGEPRDFAVEEPERRGAVGTGLIRLQSGKIAYSGGGCVWISKDEGATWSPPAEAFPNTVVGPYFLGDEMIQLSSG